jgi:UDP-N-acetylmuramate--alanine ligase
MNLFLPSDPRPVHFVGIAGAGMSGLAALALHRGVAVTGSDRSPEGAPDLSRLGAKVLQGQDPAWVEGARAVVVSAAIQSDHPELVRARELGIPVVSRKRALAELVAGGRTVAIAGTHGKTTTTVMTTEALAAAGLDPTGLAGGRVASWGGNARPGSDRLFVVEADEYDQAFLELHPDIAVVNNVEPEHLECYGNSAQALEDAFVTFANRARIALVGSEDSGADRVARRLTTEVWRFGSRAANLSVETVVVAGKESRAMVKLPDGKRANLRLQVPGMHNLWNAMGALGAAVALGADVDAALEGLAGFTGVGRRFEQRGEAAGVVVVDDYAHHPTELAATLAAARQAFPRRRVVAVFQPHLYSRTAAQHEAMGHALRRADLAFVTEVYAAREAPVPGVTGALVWKAAGAGAVFEADQRKLVDRVAEAVRPGDVVFTLGAGDITNFGPALLARLQSR